MYPLFVFSTALFVLFMLTSYAEYVRGVRVLPSLRERLDQAALRVLMGIRAVVAVVHRYFNRDIVVKLLHMGMYLALVGVRAVEEWLVQGTRTLRAFRKRRAHQAVSESLGKVHRGVDTP